MAPADFPLALIITARRRCPPHPRERHARGHRGDLVGHLNLIHSSRIHVLGVPEVAYVERMEPSRRLHYAAELVVGGPLGLIVAEAGWSRPSC